MLLDEYVDTSLQNYGQNCENLKNVAHNILKKNPMISIVPIGLKGPCVQRRSACDLKTSHILMVTKLKDIKNLFVCFR